jgi:FkbM family methyltransferase
MTTIRERKVSVDGTSYRIVSDDAYPDFYRRGFEPELVALIKSLATPSDVALDVGANVGLTALLLSTLARDVLAFEPSPATFAFLEQNIARAGKTNIRPIRVGLGETAASENLMTFPSNRAGSYITDRAEPLGGHVLERVAIETLDSHTAGLSQPCRLFIKMDVEGFEGHVLRGARATLHRFRPTAVIEMNHWCLNVLRRVCLPDFVEQITAAFPIAYAVQGNSYLDLHNSDQRYTAMHEHVIRMRFSNLACGFEPAQFANFMRHFQNGIPR